MKLVRHPQLGPTGVTVVCFQEGEVPVDVTDLTMSHSWALLRISSEGGEGRDLVIRLDRLIISHALQDNASAQFYKQNLDLIWDQIAHEQPPCGVPIEALLEETKSLQVHFFKTSVDESNVLLQVFKDHPGFGRFWRDEESETLIGDSYLIVYR